MKMFSYEIPTNCNNTMYRTEIMLNISLDETLSFSFVICVNAYTVHSLNYDVYAKYNLKKKMVLAYLYVCVKCIWMLLYWETEKTGLFSILDL